MAVQLLRPFIICELMKRRKECTHKVADNLVSAYDPQVYDIVEEIISKHPVLLNRAPTLHRLGIQAFQPRLVEGRAIRLHPLVCAGFNADFDGDQMAVHVPLSKAAQEEALHLMLASNNILGPKDGKPIVTPSQDMVLGNYYLTLEESKEDFLAKADKLDKSGDKKEAERFNVYANSEGKVFASVDDVLVAYQTKQIHLHNRIAILGSAMKKVNFTEEQNKSYLLTSVGKIIFNLIFPSDFPYINEMVKGVISPAEFAPRGSNVKELFTGREIIKPFKKGDLGKIINKVFQDYDKKGNPKTSAVLDKLKDQGFEYATVAGFTVSINDIHLVEGKQALLDQGDAKVKEIEDMYSYGLLTEKERHKQICDVWTNVLKDVQENLLDQFNKDTKNPIFMIMDSGARGNKSHITQLAGMRGLMGNTTGGTYEIPVKASFREGMSVSEFFAATHGARKGGTDTALRTADSGYLTRRLVDVSQDVIVREVDCHTDQGFEVSEIRDNSQNATIVKLYDRLVGRYALNDIVDPKTNEVIVQGNTMIQEDQAQRIVDAGIKRVTIRSLFTCQTKDGVCIHCYGRNMATGREVQIGEAVGIMAAQSIGEPGTQLTMRTFHTGGVAGSDITQGLPRVQELFEAHSPKGEATISMIDGTVDKIEEKAGVFTITVSNKLDVKEHVTSYGPTLRVKKGDVVEAGDKLTEGAIRLQDLLSYSSIEKVERYILKEVQKVYSLQEIGISDKHIEVIIKQMLRKVYIIDAGDTDLISGTSVDAVQFTEANQKVLVEGKRPAYCQPLILGITKSALGTQSFLSAASFQETTKVLTDAAIKGKTDILHGLKENVITGHLIPAGRGLISEEEEESIVNSFTVENTMAEVKDRYIEAHDRKIEELRNKFNKAEK